MSRTKNVLKMIVAGFMNQAVLIIAGFILPPLIISIYGSSINGLVNSVKQILNFFIILSVGIGAAGRIALYEPLANKNKCKINEIMSEISIFFNKLGIGFILFVIIIAFILPLVRKDEISYEIIIGTVLICGMGSFIEFIVLTKYKILLTADQKQYIISNINSQGTLINLVVSVILIYFKSPILLVQLVATFAYIVRMFLLIKYVNKIYPFLNIKNKIWKKQIKNQNVALFYKFTDIIINYAPMTIVMIVCGFEDVSVYTIYNLIFSGVVMIVYIFSNGFSASFGNQIVEKDFLGCKKSFCGYNFMFRIISFWCYTSAGILILPFISVYITNTDGVNYLLPSLGMAFTLNGIFRVMRTPAITMIDALGTYQENLKLNYFEAVLNVFLSIILTINYGMIGVLIGGSISAFFRSIFFIKNIKIGNTNISFFYESMRLLINMFFLMFMYKLFFKSYVNSFFEWIKLALFIIIINGILFFLINFIMDRNGYNELFKRIRSLKK